MNRTALGLFFVTLLAAPARGQEDPFESRLYPVEFLTKTVPDWPGVHFGLETGPAGAGVEEPRLLPPEALVNLIRTNIAEDTWTHASARLGFSEGGLAVTNRASVHAKIEPYLAYLRSAFGKLITLDGAIVLADPAFLAKVRAASPADRPASLAPDQVKQILDAAREGRQAELVKSLRVSAHPGQRVHLQDAGRHSYLRDQDVHLSGTAAVLDPVVDSFATGAGFDIRAHLEPFGGAVTMEVRADACELEALESRKIRPGKEVIAPDGKTTSGLTGEAVIQLPRLARDALRTTLTVRSGETAVVGSVLRKGRVLVFLVTPAVLALDEKPAPEPVFEEQRVLRLYDVSPLTRPVRNFGAPPDPLDAPVARMTAGQLAEMVRTQVAPESWSNKRNTISAEGPRLLVVRQKIEVLRDIDRYLGSLLVSRAQTITTETVLIGFRKGARAEWEKEIPALAAGGYFVEPEKYDRLFAEATKDRRVRIIEAAEITGFPLERVYAAAFREENFIAGFESKVGPAAAMVDPAVRTLHTGFVLDVLPRPVAGADRIEVDLRASRTTREIKEVETPSTGVGPVQIPNVEGPRWNGDVVCAKGRWTLVAIQTHGPADDAEDVALFLRARPNVLK